MRGPYIGLILAAAGPFCPCVTSKETFWPSFSVRWPAPWMALWWANRSLPPPSRVMKPKPFSSLNHFTVPVAICLTCSGCARRTEPRFGHDDQEKESTAAWGKGRAGRGEGSDVLCWRIVRGEMYHGSVLAPHPTKTTRILAEFKGRAAGRAGEGAHEVGDVVEAGLER